MNHQGSTIHYRPDETYSFIIHTLSTLILSTLDTSFPSATKILTKNKEEWDESLPLCCVA
jgi:hypothetical protein